MDAGIRNVQQTQHDIPPDRVRRTWRPVQQLNDYVMLQRYYGPHYSCTPGRAKRSQPTQCQQRGTALGYMRHVSNGWTAVARPPRQQVDGFYEIWQRLCNGRPQPMTADRCDVAVPTALQSARPPQSVVLGDAKIASQPRMFRRDANIEPAHPLERNAIGNEITN